MQVVRRLPQPPCRIGRIYVFEADEGPMAFGMGNLQNIVKHIGENNITIFFADVSKRRIGHVPEISAVNDVRNTIRRCRPAGVGWCRREARIQNGGPAQLGIERIFVKRFSFIGDRLVT